MPFDDESAAPTAALAGYTGHLLARAHQRAWRCGDAAMPPGRRPRDWAVLATVYEQGPVSQRTLGDLLGINRTIMVKLIDSLEAAGLVRRERDPADRRSYAVTPTEASAAVFAELDAAADGGEAMLAEHLTDAEHQRLNELLTRMLPATARPPQALAGRTGYLVAIAHFQMRESGAHGLRSLGLEARDFGFLTTIAAIEPCSQQRLATEMHVSGPAVVGIIENLHRTGRIERERNPRDRREHVLRLSPLGREQLAEARRIIDGLHAELGELLGPGAREELNALLTKLLGQT